MPSHIPHHDPIPPAAPAPGMSHVTPPRTPSLILLSLFAGFGAVSGYRARGGRREPLWGYQVQRSTFMQDPLKYICIFFPRELKTSCLSGNFPPKRLHFSQRRPTKGRDLSRGRKKNDSVQKTLAGIPARGGGEASTRWDVAHTHLQPRLDGAVPLRLSAAVVPEPLQVFGAVKHPRSPFQSSSPGQLLRLFHLRPLFLWGQSQGLRSTAKPLLAGRKGPRGREQETGRQRTSKHTPMGPAGRHGGEQDPPGMAPMIPQQKGAPRSSGHHPAGVTPHDKDGSPQGFHLPDKAQGTRKRVWEVVN